MKNSIKQSISFFIISFFTLIISAQNNGPNAPEASGFEPVSATDMVNLSSGDMAYVLPLLEVDGFPITLSYHAGIPMDMEASWVGLGWNINTGAITRGVVANPDDWGIGRRLNLTYLYGEVDSYSVDVGVGISKGAEVGVGLSWGSNKSISGSVSATLGPISASIDTNGNYSVGLSTKALGKKFGFGGVFDKITDEDSGGFGGSLSISGNVNKGGIAVNLGVGGSAGGMSMGMGVSISGSGVGTSYSIGANNSTSGKSGASAGASVSMNSYSAGDYSYNTKGFYIPLQIGIFSFGFGHQKTEITLSKGFNKYGYGILYHNTNTLYDNNLGQDELPGYSGDYQRRNTYGDVYEQSLPQSEEEFIGDYRNQIEKLNFTFGGYDSYDINASGIGGALKPILGQNIALIGEGYDGASIRTDRDKTKVFYHNSYGDRASDKSIRFGDRDPNKLNFSFDGQITVDARMENADILNYTGANLNLSNFIAEGTSLISRPKSGSYVETYTNAQIDNGANILTPASLKKPIGVISRNQAGYVPEGIGAYKITTPDGKIYHFSQPVYHYEQIQHNFMHFPDTNSQSVYNSSSKREATPYATHWLLTAITGPDYIDMNNNHFADEEDYGYWVRLDHGQWSNAYTWRSPYDTKEYHTNRRAKRHYSTFIDNEVEKSDPGYFLQGRKDIYYLDKIVSKNQTAIFVKDLRYDGYGTSADYVYNPSPVYFDDPIESNPIYTREHAKYDKEYLLKLDKILIFNTKESLIPIDKTQGNGINQIYERHLSNRYNQNGIIYNNLSVSSRTHNLHLSNNIIDVNDLQNFDYSSVAKVIKFNHSYTLAKETPSSGWQDQLHSNNQFAGRLTLDEIQTFGRGMIPNATENDLYSYMPPYVFDYKNMNYPHEENQLVLIPQANPNFPGKPQYKLDRANKDNWGFRNDNVDTWSLDKITTPQGATIDIEYEEDDFYIEAFGRRFWENNLRIYANTSESSEYTLFYIENQEGLDSSAEVDFTNYFQLNEDIYFDYWVARRRKHSVTGHNHWGAIDVNANPQVIKTVHQVTPTRLTIKIYNQQSSIINCDNGQNELIVGCHGSKGRKRVKNRWFCKAHGCGSHRFHGADRCSVPSASSTNDDHHKMKYKLLANKVPPGTSGGGIRVKDIVVNNNTGGRYKTSYNYDNPITQKTSGITSFNPIRGEVFVPYQNELPGPGVMYEWVTMSAIEVGAGGHETEISSKRYHYYTLQPVFDIFNPNILMKDIDGDTIFRTKVNEIAMNFNKMTAKNMKIEKNLTKIGQLISIEEFNELGHSMSKSTNTYSPRIGELSETFSSMKSVFDFDEDEDGDQSNFQLQQHYLGLSTKSEKVSVLTNIENITTAGKSTIEYRNPDNYLGTFTTSIRKLADGTEIREEKRPAYEFYKEMRSKIIKPQNKNMLTQEAITTSHVNVGGRWRTLNAQLTTWKKEWYYRDHYGVDKSPVEKERKIWRKHKTFVFKDELDEYGAYNTSFDIKDFNFDWEIGEGEVADTWLQTSEVTRYSHWSSPLEVKDINVNFVATKMGDNWSKVIASANSNYVEMYYSGAEYVAPGSDDGNNRALGNSFEGEVLGSRFRTDENAHTGHYSVKNDNPNDKVFQVVGSVDRATRIPDPNVPNTKFRPGNYKISFWTLCNEGVRIPSNCDGIALFMNGVEIEATETIRAGQWKQFNYMVELAENNNVDLYVTNKDTSGSYFDDFRMHPVYASMNSYVYDKETGALSYILNGNNLATHYCYDNAGRLCKVFKEVTNASGLTGGFKLINTYKSHYKEYNTNNCSCVYD